MKSTNFNTICIFKAYGVENLSEIQDFDKFFIFLKEKYTNKEIIDFIYELLDNLNEEDPFLLKFYKRIPEDIDREMNDDMGLTEVVKNIRSGNILPVLEEMEKSTIDIVQRGKSLIEKQMNQISLFEKGMEMLNSYEEEHYQQLKAEIKKKTDDKWKTAEMLFQKPTLVEQKEHFKTEIELLKLDVEEWRGEIIKIFQSIITVKCIDELIKIENDGEFIDLLLEQRQKIKNNPIKL